MTIHSSASTVIPRRSGAAHAILAGGLGAGTIDLLFACTFNAVHGGIAPLRVLQFIASGVLGRAAFEGGLATGILGVLLHYTILLVAAALFVAAARRQRWLAAHPLAAGVAYGLAIYTVMHLVVLPLSAAAPYHPSMLGRVLDFLVHVGLIGPAIAFATRRWDWRGTSGS